MGTIFHSSENNVQLLQVSEHFTSMNDHCLSICTVSKSLYGCWRLFAFCVFVEGVLLSRHMASAHDICNYHKRANAHSDVSMGLEV